MCLLSLFVVVVVVSKTHLYDDSCEVFSNLCLVYDAKKERHAHHRKKKKKTKKKKKKKKKTRDRDKKK